MSAALALICLLPAAPPQTLEARLLPLARAHKGRVAIAVKHLVSGETFFYNADEVMPTASLIKLPILIEAYLQVVEGKIKLSETVTLKEADKVPGSGILTEHFSAGATFPLRDAIRLMTVFSDNTATNLVLDRVGIRAVNERLSAWGLKETRLNAKVYRRDTTSVDPARSRRYGLGSTTAREMVKLLGELMLSDRVKPAAKQALLGILKKCADKDRFTRFLPADVEVAHKTGSLSNVRTDAGLIYLDDGVVAVCVLTADNADQRWHRDNAGNLFCAKVAKEVYDHFARSAKPSARMVKPKRKEEVLLIGPFSFGDLCSKSKGMRARLEDFSKSYGIKTADMLDAFNACKVSIIDTRVEDSGKSDFPSGTDPKGVVEGKFSWTFKDNKGRDLRIHLKSANVLLSHTNHDAAPPIRSGVVINPCLAITLPTGGRITTYFVPPTLTYDVNGKLR